MSKKVGKRLYTSVRLLVAEQIEELAENEGRSISQTIAVLLEEALKNRNTPNKPG